MLAGEEGTEVSVFVFFFLEKGKVIAETDLLIRTKDFRRETTVVG